MTTRPATRTHAKICGIRTIDAARAAVAGGADFLGFNFYPPVRRYITPEAARAIIDTIRAEGTRATMVGLFVGATAPDIAAVAQRAGLDAIQLSGHEPTSDLADLADLRLHVLKVLHLDASVNIGSVLTTAATYLTASTHLPAWPHGEHMTLLIDAAVAGQFGGTGQRADWSLAAQLAAQYPCGLAGGLNQDNVASAIAMVRPWLVDVSSGVETDGMKDSVKIAAFLLAAGSSSV